MSSEKKVNEKAHMATLYPDMNIFLEEIAVHVLLTFRRFKSFKFSNFQKRKKKKETFMTENTQS